MKHLICIRLGFAASLMIVSNAFAQGTVFTYQGHLNENGNPANGIYDLRFALFDAVSGGGQIGGTLTNSTVAASNGLFTTSLDFGATAFNGSPRWLEIAVRPGGSGGAFTALSPRQPMTSVPYALYALTPAGPQGPPGGSGPTGPPGPAGASPFSLSGSNAIYLNGLVGIGTSTPGSALDVNGAVNAANFTGNGAGLTGLNGGAIANGTITSAKLAAGSAVANLNASGQSGVASGGLVLSISDNNNALINAGYVKLGTMQGNDAWQKLDNGEPSERSGHTAIWTGVEMIVWGGGRGLNDGGRYNPAANSWTPLTTTDAPAARTQHTAVWTGSEMIIWGGDNGSSLNDGGRYNPAADTWAAVTLNGAPAARSQPTAVWTGAEMIIWGGGSGNVYFNDIGRYNPSANTWTVINASGAPTARIYPAAVWTGTELIIWSGVNTSAVLNDGARFNPANNTWSPVNTSGAPVGRILPTAVWTGTEMIIWGGETLAGFLNDGGRYNPTANTWTPTATNGAPTPRVQQTAVWTGSAMVVWGGVSNSAFYLDGGRYNPAANTWSATATNGAPAGRSQHTAIWTGSEMIVWGGYNNGDLNDGGRYNPAANSWSAVAATHAPIARYEHAGVWTGSEMIVWGGYNPFLGDELASGGRYNPALNRWTEISTNGAPSRRQGNSAVWTGREMIIWGGSEAVTFGLTSSGSRYNPASDSWTATSLIGAASPRTVHTAVWTGTEMIVWGGSANTLVPLNSGGRYNPTSNSWIPVTLNSAPIGRTGHTAVWSGSEMIIWGGTTNGYWAGALNSGGRYNPATDGWSDVFVGGVPLARMSHTAVWTGSDMVVWGGIGNGPNGNEATFLGDGGRYNPTLGWRISFPVGTPAPRIPNPAVWTGSEMVVWGGSGNNQTYNDVGIYDPVGNNWRIVTPPGPSARGGHSAVWTGSQMIIFGGSFAGDYYNDNWAFTPGKMMFLYQRP